MSSDSTPDLPTLDALTSGALTAPTSGERSSRLRDWLASDPSPELMQQVFKEMSARDKGASKLLREKLDELKRTKTQDSLAQEWADKAQSLLQAHQFKVADAMAWQRDAAKAGAPLSREPLAGLRQALTERIKHVDELEHRAQVQRETALLLTQRIEVLSTKSWQEAIDQQTVLQADLKRLHDEFEALQSDAHWSSVDPKYPSLVAETTKHIPLVWDAFSAALAQTQAAAQDANLPLPAVPAWADQLRQSRGESVAVTPTAPANNAKAEAPPQVSQVALQVPSMLLQLEKEVALGHSKAMSSAASLLRAALKTKGLQLDTELAQQVQTTLAASAELEGWQRKRADEIRLQLVTKAEALLQAPVAAPAATEVTDAEESQAVPETSPEGDTEVSADAASTVPEVIPEAGSAAAVDYSQWVPAMGGRKLQDTLRQLRDEWKKTDQGGLPNHGLWKRFDQACNRAYPFVQAWLGKAKAESAAHREGRLALLAEVAAWTEAHQSNTDWKTQARELHQFSERWRNSGHLSEKAFADMQTQWKAAIKAAHVGLEAAQTQSITLRRAMIEEAKALGEAPQLRIDAVKALQQRWQIESQAVPVDRKLAQKLWDAFRQPLDEAFSRKTQPRAAAPAQNLSEHDKAVMAAAEELEKAIAQGDAAEIRQAMAHMNAVSAGQAAAPVATSPAPVATPPEEDASPPISEPPEGEPTAQPEEALAPAPKTLVVKKVVAVRGDDRPGQKKTEPASAGRFGDKPGPRRPERDTGNRRGPDAGRGGLRDKPAYETRGPRLGDAAFRAQRQALELADTALRKLAMQAHGETLVHLLGAWQQRQSEQLPAAKELGARLSAQQRQDWAKALQAAPQGSPDQALLRLEIAAEVPTPASHVDARRMLQLQLLTKRNDAGPAQTWAQDVAQVLGSIYEEESAKRVQAALKVLLKK